MRGDPIRILRRFAYFEEGSSWKVLPGEGSHRTEMGRRMFSSRIRRLWSVLSEEEKTFNPNNNAHKQALRAKISKIDNDWILWGKTTSDKNPSTFGDNSNSIQVEDTYEENQSEENSNYETESSPEYPIQLLNEETGRQIWSGEELLSILMIEDMESEAERYEGQFPFDEATMKEYKSKSIESEDGKEEDKKKFSTILEEDKEN